MPENVAPLADCCLSVNRHVAPWVERLCAQADALRVRVSRDDTGVRLVDAGCGFGGTLAHLDEQVRGAALVGLNIDRRQLERARATTLARPTGANRIGRRPNATTRAATGIGAR